MRPFTALLAIFLNVSLVRGELSFSNNFSIVNWLMICCAEVMFGGEFLGVVFVDGCVERVRSICVHASCTFVRGTRSTVVNVKCLKTCQNAAYFWLSVSPGA